MFFVFIIFLEICTAGNHPEPVRPLNKPDDDRAWFCWFSDLGFGSLWLMSMSLGLRGGSTFITSLAMLTIASVVFSSHSSLMPEMRRLLRRPCCSRASFWWRSSHTSARRSLITASRWARASLRDWTWALREVTLSRISRLELLIILDSYWNTTPTEGIS